MGYDFRTMEKYTQIIVIGISAKEIVRNFVKRIETMESLVKYQRNANTRKYKDYSFDLPI